VLLFLLLLFFSGTFFSELALVEDVSSEYSYIASTDTECFSLSRVTFNDIIGSKKQRFIQQAYTGEIDVMLCGVV
jgi:CRP-like cAMP-binding protein